MPNDRHRGPRFQPRGGLFRPNDEQSLQRMQELADARDARQREIEAQMSRIRQLLDQSLIRFSVAHNLRAEQADESYAAEFLARHQRLNQAHLFGSALKTFSTVSTDEERRAALDPAFKRANYYGGFLEQYTPEMVRDWMRSPERVFFYAQGNRMDSQTLAEEATVTAADIHIELAEDSPDAPLACSLPNISKGDDWYDAKDQRAQDIVAEIEANHAIAGSVRDLAADDAYAHLGFASTARVAAFEHIKRLPRKNPVRYLVAELFSITGLKLQDGTEIKAPSPIENIMSMIVHARSKRYPAIMGWRLRGKEAPVYLEGDDPEQEPSKLQVDWHALVHTL